MKNLLRCLLLSSGLAGLAGCCANNACNCQDLQADSVYIRLNLVPAKGKAFSKSEIDTVYLLRYAKANLTRRRATDSITLVRARRWSNALLQQVLANSPDTPSPVAGLNDTSVVVLNNTAPFPASGPTGKLSNFGYALLVAPNRRGPRYVFALDSVQLKGQYKGDGCCTCYQNTEKLAFLTGQPRTAPVDLTETDGTPRPLLFVRP